MKSDRVRAPLYVLSRTLIDGQKSYLRGKRIIEAAVRELIELASRLKRTRGGGFHKGVPVQDNTPPST